MSATQYFPIPPEIMARACAMVSEKVSQLPFLRGGVSISGELLGVAMESLNAVPSKALALTTLQGAAEDGLDRCLDERLHIAGKAAAPVIADVLCSAGIAEPALIADRQAHRERRGIRLVPPWTWHIASAMAPSVRLGGSAGDDPGMSWMDLCPVCRTGILSRITGKQLFGIPKTDFIIECSSCGAKFIPVGPAFRLVSIATIRDPLWKRWLDKTQTPREWSAIARGPGTVAPEVRTPAPRAVSGSPVPPVKTTVTTLSNGSIAVPAGGKTLYFRPVSLSFSGGVKEGAFARVEANLADLLTNPVYTHLRDPVNAKYSRYLPLKSGLFLSQLKERHDSFYREFLNPYGDGKFGTFRLAAAEGTARPGILLVVVSHGIYDALDCSGSIQSLVNDRFGRVSPEDCLLTGDPLRCRMNTLLCTGKKEAGPYIYPEENEEVRWKILGALIGKDST